MNYCGPISIFAYGDTIMIFASVQQALNSTGIGLNHVAVGKEAAIRTEGNVMKAAERHSLVSINYEFTSPDYGSHACSPTSSKSSNDTAMETPQPKKTICSTKSLASSSSSLITSQKNGSIRFHRTKSNVTSSCKLDFRKFPDVKAKHTVSQASSLKDRKVFAEILTSPQAQGKADDTANYIIEIFVEDFESTEIDQEAMISNVGGDNCDGWWVTMVAVTEVVSGGD
ncbi:hypothetical protein T459_04161 [Capsicum annuum]|uniref:Uncharacterized protein n=1 Tax=Capsicum annuum TaxID=4072 RepID=A0A2G3A4A3_CAPAN|nr:hypothetical protein T459_04161 [Capsicum annuum]